MDAQVVQNDQRDLTAWRRTLHGPTELRTEGGGAPSGSKSPVEPAVAPIHQAEADLVSLEPDSITCLSAPGRPLAMVTR